jgi:hypothetical protein
MVKPVGHARRIERRSPPLVVGNLESPVALYRIAAAVNPDRYNPPLTISLSNLGVRFSELGRDEEAAEGRKEPERLDQETESGD